MAIVKNQSIPTDHFEENLDPPLEFKDQYRRVLSEGIFWPKLPEDFELVTYSKKDSRPAQRNDSFPGASPDQRDWRGEFDDCIQCWKNQVQTDSDISPCSSAGSKKYLPDWKYIQGAKNTYYNLFMQDCLNWKKEHPNEKPPKCEDLLISPSSLDLCPGETLLISVFNGHSPFDYSADCGSLDNPTYPSDFIKFQITFTAPQDTSSCPIPITISFSDSQGRRGCCLVSIKPLSECCCASSPGISLLADTLLMGCNQNQTISVDPEIPGCPPYTWQLSGGGTLTPDEGDPNHGSAVYHSPSSNANCSSNPTIIVTDACGDSAQVHIAVNCSSASGDAYVVWEDVVTWNKANCGPSCYNGNGPLYRHTFNAYIYNCNGILYRTRLNACTFICAISTPISMSNLTICNYGGGYIYPLSSVGWHLVTGAGTRGANCGCLDPYAQNCGTWLNNAVANAAVPPAGGPTGIPGVGDPWDVRTSAQKLAGCCPLNPITGLPF